MHLIKKYFATSKNNIHILFVHTIMLTSAAVAIVLLATLAAVQLNSKGKNKM